MSNLFKPEDFYAVAGYKLDEACSIAADIANNKTSEMIELYIKKLNYEKESLIAKFISENKCNTSDVCLIEVRKIDQFVYYVDFKSKHIGKLNNET